jgi:hypothetical protein
MFAIVLVEENQVMIDNLKLPVDCSSLRGKYRSVHWHTNKGFVEPAEPRMVEAGDVITDTKLIDHLIQAWTFRKMILENEGRLDSEAIVHTDYNPDLILDNLQRIEDQLFELQ